MLPVPRRRRGVHAVACTNAVFDNGQERSGAERGIVLDSLAPGLIAVLMAAARRRCLAALLLCLAAAIALPTASAYDFLLLSRCAGAAADASRGAAAACRHPAPPAAPPRRCCRPGKRFGASSQPLHLNGLDRVPVRRG